MIRVDDDVGLVEDPVGLLLCHWLAPGQPPYSTNTLEIHKQHGQTVPSFLE